MRTDPFVNSKNHSTDCQQNCELNRVTISDSSEERGEDCGGGALHIHSSRAIRGYNTPVLAVAVKLSPASAERVAFSGIKLVEMIDRRFCFPSSLVNL